MYTIEHLGLLLLSIVNVNFQMVSVLQSIEYCFKFLYNRCPEIMKLKIFCTPCWFVAELFEDLCDLVFFTCKYSVHNPLILGSRFLKIYYLAEIIY